jgi:WD40 repeat protein
MTVDWEKELLGLPASLSIAEKTETLIDYAVDSSDILYAAGSRSKTGRIAAVNLQTGAVLWDRVFEGTKEFCTVIDSPDGRYLLAGNRDGLLYKIKADSGEIEKTIVLLEPGETRPITNDYSVLNLAFSPDGQCYVATINPPAYILLSGTDKLLTTKFRPTHKLVSKIAFSPDSRFLATSDIRAGYPIKIWPLSEKH